MPSGGYPFHSKEITKEITQETLAGSNLFAGLQEHICNLQAPMMDNAAAKLTIVYPKIKAED